MEKEKLIKDLEEVIESKADNYFNSVGYYYFSENEIKGIIDVLKKQ